MIIAIQKGKCSAEIDTHGAELKSYVVDGSEYIWEGDPDVWAGTAPILFPIVGLLKDGFCIYEGNQYKIPKHGFVRNSELQVLDQKDDKVSFLLRASEDTKAVYPFDFEFIVKFSFESDRLVVGYKVVNVGVGQMYFTLGSHPAFKVPFAGGAFDDYYIEFNQNETLERYTLTDGLVALKREPYLNDEKVIPLTKDLFNDDALIFRDIKSDRIAIRNRINDRQLVVETGGAPHLGIWAKPEAPYVCIEPWYSMNEDALHDGDLTTKDGIFLLEQGEEFETFYAVSVE